MVIGGWLFQRLIFQIRGETHVSLDSCAVEHSIADLIISGDKKHIMRAKETLEDILDSVDKRKWLAEGGTHFGQPSRNSCSRDRLATLLRAKLTN